MKQHTPGPWHIDGFNLSRVIVIDDTKAHRPTTTIARTADLKGPENLGEEHANARLIAAAPDLLAALQRIASTDAACDCAKRSWYGDDHDTACPITIAKSAIQKAKGK